MENKKKVLLQFQGLRAVAFLAIFISHSKWGGVISLGPWGVSIFFNLSGFLMMYNYYQHEDSLNVGLKFTFNKIKKLYPLHIITMFIYIFYEVLILKYSIKEVIEISILHSLLIQTYIPYFKIYATLNGLSWYLCASVLSYFMFPIILKHLKKENKNIFKVLISFISIQIIVALFASKFGNESTLDNFSIQWIIYYCPLTRLLDFIIGCCLGILFLEKEKQKEMIVWPVWIFIFISLYFYDYMPEYIKYTLLFEPTTICIIWLVANNQGLTSIILKNRILIKLGDLSPYTFLIHGICIKGSYIILPKLFKGMSSFNIVLVAFILTLILSMAWIKLEKEIFKIKK